MKQLEVKIMGQGYLLGCPDGGEERLHEAVQKVDAAMCRIRDAGKIRARQARPGAGRRRPAAVGRTRRWRDGASGGKIRPVCDARRALYFLEPMLIGARAWNIVWSA